ncbi:unnamed protein product [Symbiodinium sp. CCMP2456]|nr:unnamed protein product [Symbiodinium sp. CCMP2456]
MRSEKRAKREHESREELVNALQDATFLKDGQAFTVSAKAGQTGGIRIVLQKQPGRGNRFVRKIAFAKFVRAAFGMNTSNVALSALLNVDASTIPRLQKTCAGVFMASQTRLLARILLYCQRNKPLSVHRQFKWDESTISTTLNPGGVSQPVRSAWSMLVARARLLITWSSGATLLMRVVLPTIPLISSTAQQIYYGIRHHPSYYAVNHMLDLIDATAELRCTVQEMDGAYANLRLHHHMLSLKEYNPQEPGGAYLATARCQSHATHLISVSMLALIGGNLLARLYGLCVFLRNLGYLLRLQLALKQWLEALWILWVAKALVAKSWFAKKLMAPIDKLDIVPGPSDDLEADVLMQETTDFLETWHYQQHGEGDDGEDGSAHTRATFEKNLAAFKESWNGSFTGRPMHRCGFDHGANKSDIVERMASSFIALLLTCLPAVPAPNKWTKIFPSSDFVAMGVLINSFLPSLFEIAFQPVMFKTDDMNHQDQDADPRLLEGLFFSAVQGKRYLASRDFLGSSDAQWCCRCWLIVSEHLRRLVYFWLRNLKQSNNHRKTCSIFQLLDVRNSAIWAVLQNVAHQLLDDHGRHRLCMMWRWDASHACCVNAGFARALKKQNVSADALASDAQFRALLKGLALLLDLSIADVECKHALSRHWSDRPFPTLTAKHINKEASVAVHEAVQQAESLLHPGKGAAAALSGTYKVANNTISIKAKHKRAKSGYMFFRDDLINIMKQTHGAVNPCSKDFWSELKKSWENLPQQRKDYYNELAFQAQGQAAQAKEIAKRRAGHPNSTSSSSLEVATPEVPVALSQDSQGVLLPLAVPGMQTTSTARVVSYNPWVLASAVFEPPDLLDVARDIQKHFQERSSETCHQDLRDECIRLSPISEEQLEKVWRQNLANGITWAAALKRYNVESQRFTVPPAADVFPERVNYQGCCGVFCRDTASPRDLQLFAKLLVAFDRVVAGCGAVAVASKTDILIKHSLMTSAGDIAYETFTWMTALSARSGIHASSQIFVLLDVLEEHAVPGGCRLRLASQAPVQSRLKWCSQLLEQGPLKHYTEQEFAKHLLERFHEFSADTISLTRLSFRDVSLSTVDITGVWPGWTELLVNSDVGAGLHVAADAGAGQDVQAADAVAGPAGGVAEAASFDLLEEVVGGVSRGRGRGRGRGKQTSSQLRQKLVASLPVDPHLQEHVEADLQALLAEEQIMLPDPAVGRDAVGEGHVHVENAGNMLDDPVLLASLDAEFKESMLSAAACCTEANTGQSAIFEESGDEAIIEESCETVEQDIDPPPATGGSADDEGAEPFEDPDELVSFPTDSLPRGSRDPVPPVPVPCSDFR